MTERFGGQGGRNVGERNGNRIAQVKIADRKTPTHRGNPSLAEPSGFRHT